MDGSSRIFTIGGSFSLHAQAALGQELAGGDCVRQRQRRVAGVEVLLADHVQLPVQRGQLLHQVAHSGRPFGGHTEAPLATASPKGQSFSCASRVMSGSKALMWT